MRPIIILFDVDMTLVCTDGAGKRALERAMTHVFGPGPWLDFSLDGQTDPHIVRCALEKRRLKLFKSELHWVFEIYLKLLKDEVRCAKKYRTFPGVKNLLKYLRTKSDTIAMGLGTGNLKRGAQIKLRRLALDGFFSFGGFGSDHENRAEILRKGAERGAKKLHARLSDCRVVVIGDTPKDVVAALTIGAEPLGVGTGDFTPSLLNRAGARASFKNLNDRRVLEVILAEQGCA